MYVYQGREYPHLSPDGKKFTPTPAERENEAYCTACLSRVTIATDGSVEFGHARLCPNRELENNVSDGRPYAEHICDRCGAGFPSESDLHNHDCPNT